MISTETRPKTTTAAPGQECQIRAWVNSFDAGLTEMSEKPYAIVCMYLGPSIEVRCLRGGTVRHGREVAGDLDIIPARTPSAWETLQGGATLVMCVPDALLRAVAIELGKDAGNIEIADRFQMRDPVIEHIGWAVKADLDVGGTGGRLFRESMGRALATRLLQRHYRGALPMRETRGGLSQSDLERAVAHIEDNLGARLSLTEIAAVAGMSISHLKTLFRSSMGVPVYEYVLRRRVERAQVLLRDESLSIAQVAIATGFAHQSHLSRHMQKILGATPMSVRKEFMRQSSLTSGGAVPRYSPRQ